MALDVTATDARNDWSYLAEGGASMVFSYIGPSHPTYNRTVLRLRKSPRENSQSPPYIPCDRTPVGANDPSIAFQKTVTSQLIPKEYLPSLQAVRVTFLWLTELAGVTEWRRPVDRAVKDGIDLHRCKAVLATDLVGGSGWAVEIKPKWGFLPSPAYLSPSTRRLKTQHCRFCMHTHLKSIKGSATVTKYCPLDLFSGDETRVRRALRNLWEAWVGSHGKVNNLRFFNEGKVVRPGDVNAVSFLGRKLLCSKLNMSLPDLMPSFIDAVVPMTLENPFFFMLANLQRNLDSLDIEGLSQLWSRFHPGRPLGQGETEPTLAEWDGFIQTYLSGGEDTLRYNILAYILSATFKDCSVILRFESPGEAENTLSVIDLDPKSVSRLSGWEALDRNIVENFGDAAAADKGTIPDQIHDFIQVSQLGCQFYFRQYPFNNRSIVEPLLDIFAKSGL